MKPLQYKIFVLLAYSLLFLKLFSMEEEDPSHNKLSNTFPLPLKNKKEGFKISIYPKTSRSQSKNQDFDLSKSNKKDNELPKEVSEFSIESISLAPSNYLGPLPEGAEHIMQAFHANIIERKLQPMLVKIVGPKDVGKTALIHTIAQKLTSDNNHYLEIDITSKQYDPSKLDPESDIKSFINNYYVQKNYIKSTAIIAFIKGLPAKGIDFKKLRSFLSERQQPAPLLILHEANKAHNDDYNYHDKIIHVDKPTQAHFKEFLAYIYTQNGLNCEGLTGETLEKLEGFLIPRVQRIAEETIRKAILEKRQTITNELIQESIGKKRPTKTKKEFPKDKNEIII